MLVSLTVGKVDAGVAVLLTEDKRLIEFPSILLPPDIHSGSIVDINVSRNHHAELVAEQKFSTLQTDILDLFGARSPSTPVLRCRNATQTSVVVEWDPIDLATAELRSLSLYRNGTKAGVIPRDKLSTKISGLALDTDYTFHLVLRTSAGQYTSEKLKIRTHKMTDLSGITVTPGVLPSALRDSLAEIVHRIGAKLLDTVRIDTTHFVCTEPRGQAWEKAVEMNVPVVVPDWLLGCEREGRIVGVRGYYLDADPKLRKMGPSTMQQQQQGQSSQQSQQQQRNGSSAPTVSIPHRGSPQIEHTPPTPDDAVASQASVPSGRHERVPVESGSLAGTTVVPRPVEDEDEDSDDTERAGEEEEEEKPKHIGEDEGEDEEDEAGEGDTTTASVDSEKFDEVAL